MTREEREALERLVVKGDGLSPGTAREVLDALDAAEARADKAERDLERWKSVEGLAALYSRDLDALRAERDRLAEALRVIAGFRCETEAIREDAKTCRDFYPADSSEWCSKCLARAALAGEETKS